MTESHGTSSTLSWPRNALHELRHRPAAQLPALDGLRAMAVLLVICDHWVYEWVTIAKLPSPGIEKLPMFYWGWTGVDLFFVLSGFLIGKQLWNELYRTGTISVSQFILRRGLRIWPLYYVTMVLLMVLPSIHAPQWPDWVMLSNYYMTRYARSWSLSTEEQFYLLVPLLMHTCRRFIPQRWWPASVVVLLAAVPISRAFTFASLSAQGIEPKLLSNMMYSAFHLHCEALLVGLLIAWISIRRKPWLAPAAVGAAAPRVIAAAFALAVVGAALRTANREVFAYLALACVFGAALCVALADRSILSAPLRWRIWYPIARLSFGMYLNHLILREPSDTIIAMVTSWLGASSTLAFLIGLILTVLASAATAAVTFVLIEHPGLVLRDRWLARRKAASAKTAPATA